MKTSTKWMFTGICFLAAFVTSVLAATNTLQVFNFDFGASPATHLDPTINVGDTVEWVWASGGTGHSTTAAAGQSESWNSGVHAQPFTFDHTFTQAGTFNYYCIPHGSDIGGGNVSGMSGKVIVTATAGGGSGTNLLYFDDFEQFPGGSLLTETNYFPLVGLGAEIHTNDNSGMVSTTVVASNLLGSVRAFFDRVSPPYQASYRGEPTVAVTNQVVALSWKLWIEAVKTPASTLGGFVVSLATTNFNDQPVLIFNDAGQIMIFTNSVDNPDPAVVQQATKQIGTWSAGKVLTNQLVLDFPAGTLSFSVNSGTLTTMPIPKCFTNFLQQARMEVFEGFSNVGSFNSTGNRFALDDVQILLPNANRDVGYYIAAAKGVSYLQTNTGAATIQTNNPYGFHAEVTAVDSNTVLGATLHPPTGAAQPLAQESFDPVVWELTNSTSFANQAALDAAYTNGSYRLSMLGANQGLRSPTLNLTGNTYPSAPQVANWAACQAVDSAQDFTLQWINPSLTSNDYIIAEVDSETTPMSFSTGNASNFTTLNGTATSVVIPANTLASGTTYDGRVIFIKTVTRDTTSVPGATGFAGYYKLTQFGLTTIAPAVLVDVSLQKTTDFATILQGGNNAYQVIAQNNGTNTATGVSITDLVPANLIIQGSPTVSQGSATLTGHTITYNAGTLGAGGTATLTFNVTAPSTGQVCNVATLTTAANNLSTATVAAACFTVNPAYSDLALTKNVDTGTVNQGDNITYTLHVVNNGPNTATGATVSDAVPAGFGIVSNVTSKGTITSAGNAVTANLGDIANAGTATITILARANLAGSWTNTATSTANSSDTNAANNAASVIVTVNQTSVDVGVLKTADAATVPATSNLTYTITVTNAGPQAAYGVVVQDSVPANASVVSAVTSAGSTSITGNLVTGNLGALPAGQSAVVTLVVTPSVVGSLTNVATVTTTSSDSDLSNNAATNITTVTVPPLADLAVTAASNVATASLNRTFTYTLVVTNKGPAAAVDAELEDTLPAGVAYSNSTTTVGTCVFSNGIVSCDFGSLASGSSAAVTIFVTATATGSVCNAGTASSAVTDPVPANNTGSACAVVTINDLALTAFKATKKATLSATKTNIVGKLAVTVQNRSSHVEVIPDLAKLNALVTIELTPIGTNACAIPLSNLVPPKAKFPIVLASGKSLKLAYTLNLICATDPLPTSKLGDHGDWEYLVTVDRSVLDGLPDSHPVDDVCPRNALGIDPYPNGRIKDKGCGRKLPDGTFTAVVTDVVIRP